MDSASKPVPNGSEVRTSCRKRKSPLEELREHYSETEQQLEEILRLDLSLVQSDAEQIKSHGSELKKATKLYNQASRSLSSRYISIASYFDSQVIREKRTELQKDAEEVLASLNGMLTELGHDEMSNIDNISLRSGVSLRSQLGSATGNTSPTNISEPIPTEESVQANIEMRHEFDTTFYSTDNSQHLSKPHRSNLHQVFDNANYETQDSYTEVSVPKEHDANPRSTQVEDGTTRYAQRLSATQQHHNTTKAELSKSQVTFFDKMPDRVNSLLNNKNVSIPNYLIKVPQYKPLFNSNSYCSNVPHSLYNFNKSLSNKFDSQDVNNDITASNSMYVTCTNDVYSTINTSFSTALPKLYPPSDMNHMSFSNKNTMPPTSSYIAPKSFVPQFATTSDSNFHTTMSNTQHTPSLPKFLNPTIPPHSQGPQVPYSHNQNERQFHHPSNYLPPYLFPQNQHSSFPLEVMSNHLLEQELMKKSIEPFNGTAHTFWPWIGKLENYIGSLNLNPLKILQLLESYTTGEPQKMITRQLAATGLATMREVNEVWENLIYRYGSSQRITEELLQMIEDFPVIKTGDKGIQLQNLHDLLKVVQYNLPKCPELCIMNLSSGLKNIRIKLPDFIQNEWRKVGLSYEQSHHGSHPPFDVFVDFIKHQARLQSNKNYESLHPTIAPRKNIRALQTQSAVASYDSLHGNKSGSPDFARATNNSNRNHPQVQRHHSSSQSSSSTNASFKCTYHQSNLHELADCRSFKKLPYNEKRSFIFDNKLCFKCLGQHRAADCKTDIKCNECSLNHPTSMHRSPREFSRVEQINKENQMNDLPVKDNGHLQKPNVSKALCTTICNGDNTKNCSKTLLVELTMEGVPNKSLTTYCILDEQSDTTLVDDKVLQFFGKDFPSQEYCIKFASQSCELNTAGHIVTGLRVRGVKEQEIIDVPLALSCPAVADTSGEVATPHIVSQHEDIASYAKYFPEFDPHAEVLILIGRNCGRAMATECLSSSEPYVHRTPLGFSLVGNVCKENKKSDTKYVHAFKTSLRPTKSVEVKYNFTPKQSNMFDVFQTLPDDDSPGLSNDDRQFMTVMSDNVSTTAEGNIQLPLPLKSHKFPNNESAVYNRTKKTLDKLKTQTTKLNSCIQSMQKSLDARFVEQVPPCEISPKSKWYLPIFCVEQQKKSKVRLVFDASARYYGTSLNDLLFQGPDLNSQLRGVLLRFREKPIAFSADIQSMFSNFKVPGEQTNYLRFFWFRNNNPDEEIVPYRSSSHIFGCTSSPAVANFGMKFCASTIRGESVAVKECITKSFYVDDCLFSADDVENAIQILAGTVEALKQYNIRLHKIVSNSNQILHSFPSSELASEPSQLPLEQKSCHSALGITWDTANDLLVMKVQIPNKIFSKRGVLSIINSLYDPSGMICPVVLQGRLIQREILPPKTNNSEVHEYGWDDILPAHFQAQWKQWLSLLSELNSISIPRSFYPLKFNTAYQEIHIFSDASLNAIGYVCYMRSINEINEVHVAFIHAASKVSPRSATTIPRLELCAALEAARCASTLYMELSTKPKDVFFHCDSQIVLGYISNNHRRFSKYVERRVHGILDLTEQKNWMYVSTKDNPADIASRPHTPSELLSTCWFTGPEFLHDVDYSPSAVSLDPCNDPLPEEKEVNENVSVNVFLTSLNETALSGLFKQCNSFDKLINIVTLVIKFIHLTDYIRQRLGVATAPRQLVINRDEAIKTLVRAAQKEAFPDVLGCLQNKKNLPENHPIAALNPQLDNNGVIRVGGRLKNANILFSVKYPMLLPKDHYLSMAVVRHFHKQIKHQGSHISHGAIVQAGFHIHNGRQLIRRFIDACVLCRKLRGSTNKQLMADLPIDRLEEVPPFTNVGVDVFGPFHVQNGVNTRRNSSTKKIWGLIFVCLPSRAIHLEPLEGMDVSSFRNALTRFFSIRGTCKVIRSDQGSNFVCAKKQLEAIDINLLSEDLKSKGIEWKLNPPHASHHAGSWERKIGSVRRILEASIALMNHRSISRDEFATLLAEASSIVNNTPLWAIPANPNEPLPISPAMLLTLKTKPTPPNINDFTEDDILAYGKQRYRRVQYLTSEFWRQWRNEYIFTLNKRHKWKSIKPCITKGDVVLIRDKNAPRNQWPTGQVQSVKLSDDNLVRSVTINIPPLHEGAKLRTVDRPITDLVLLVPSVNHHCLNPAH